MAMTHQDIKKRKDELAQQVTIIKRRTCNVCGFLENCDFRVMDDAWRTIVPIEYRGQIVCIRCFEAFASAKQIELLRRPCVIVVNSEHNSK